MAWILLFVPAFLLTTNNLSILFIVASIMLSLGYIMKNKNTLTFSRYDLIFFICLSSYFIGSIPITIFDGSTARYFQGGVRLLLCIPVYYALRNHLESNRNKFTPYVEYGLVIGTLGTFIVASYQYFILDMARVDGFLFSINFGYLACALAFLALTFSCKSKIRWPLLLGSALCTSSVIFTYTRGAIVAIPILIVIIALLNIKTLKKRYIFSGFLTFLIIITSLYNYSEKFKQRADYTLYELSMIASGDLSKSKSSGYRLQYWYGAIEAFKASPLIGLPYNQREELNHQLFIQGKISQGASEITRGHAHNQYLEMLATNGILGLISIFFILVIPLFIFGYHYLKFKSPWSLSATVFVSGFAIYGLTEVPLTANLIGSFYGFMLAVFFAIVAVEKQNKTVL